MKRKTNIIFKDTKTKYCKDINSSQSDLSIYNFNQNPVLIVCVVFKKTESKMYMEG